MTLGTIELILMLGVLFSFVLPVVIIIYVVKFISNKQISNMKKCGFCAEMIQPDAIVCRFCNREVK